MRLQGRPSRVLFSVACLLAAVPLAAQRGPAPELSHLPPDVLALACAPFVVGEPPLADLQVTGGQDSFRRHSYTPGDLVTINAGTDNGIEVGQQFYTRRLAASAGRPASRGERALVRTTGWIRVYAVDDRMSLATVAHACEAIDVGDYLEPFVLPAPTPQTNKLGKPERDNYGRIVAGLDRRTSFAAGDFVVIDRGADFGIVIGSRFVVYRDKLQENNFLYDLGEAVAVSVGPTSSTLRVLVSRDAFQVGDYVGMRQ